MQYNLRNYLYPQKGIHYSVYTDYSVNLHINFLFYQNNHFYTI